MPMAADGITLVGHKCFVTVETMHVLYIMYRSFHYFSGH